MDEDYVPTDPTKAFLKNAPGFDVPSKDISIWRYIVLAKFLSILETNSLFFTRADCLGDKWEASITKADLEFRELLKGNWRKKRGMKNACSISSDYSEQTFKFGGKLLAYERR